MVAGLSVGSAHVLKTGALSRQRRVDGFVPAAGLGGWGPAEPLIGGQVADCIAAETLLDVMSPVDLLMAIRAMTVTRFGAG